MAKKLTAAHHYAILSRRPAFEAVAENVPGDEQEKAPEQVDQGLAADKEADNLQTKGKAKS